MELANKNMSALQSLRALKAKKVRFKCVYLSYRNKPVLHEGKHDTFDYLNCIWCAVLAFVTDNLT